MSYYAAHTLLHILTRVKILQLLPIDRERGDVESVVAVVEPDGDLGSPVDNTEHAAVGILPVGVVLDLLVQGVLRASQGRLVLLGRAQLRLRVLDFSGKSDDSRGAPW